MRVQVAFGEPIDVHGRDATPEEAARVTEEELWPEVEETYSRLRAHPGLIAAGIAALGLGGLAYRRRRRR